MLKRVKYTAVNTLIVAAFFASGAAAQQAGSPGGLSLSWGAGQHHQRVFLAYETPSFWTYNFSGGAGRLEAVGEFGVAHWTADGRRRASNLWQASATPFLRWWPNDYVFLEAGIGINGFTRTRFADRTISTAFQFGDHIGVGYQITRNHRFGLRFSHFSNASIKRPNQGLNVLQAGYLYQF